jgi:hypothetical protein
LGGGRREEGEMHGEQRWGEGGQGGRGGHGRRSDFGT